MSRTLISYTATEYAHLYVRATAGLACGRDDVRIVTTTPGTLDQVDCTPCRRSSAFAHKQATALLAATASHEDGPHAFETRWHGDDNPCDYCGQVSADPIHAVPVPVPFTCADCGTDTADTYVVTGAVDDREGRTEVCLPCHNV